ncbi:MAG: TonB-dependent receptor plug domain-containing protein, partial [Muribaculum sp.]|nr:TonB-dependent receptor plug domain-containing protein [Muribaculum sp.]
TNITTTDDYATAALGTSFVVDGIPVNTNADMQSTTDSNRSGRIASGKGVDMRTISTDDIESVEIVRGIASVEYGELTSGLVNIKRKHGLTRFEARFKADTKSRLFYVGKGFSMPAKDWTINVSADYLDSKVDPRNSRENFQRVTGSLRSNSKWNRGGAIWTMSNTVAYTGTFERDKNDPDLNINGARDFYISDKHQITLNNSLVVRFPGLIHLESATAMAGFSHTDDRLHQEKTVAAAALYPIPCSLTQGVNYIGFLPMVYDGELDVLGKPVTAFAKLVMRMSHSYRNFTIRTNYGVEWNYSKNFGAGRVYDLERPLTAGATTRPRAFSDVPAMSQLSAYAEANLDWSLSTSRLSMQAGVRETQLLNLDSRYYLSLRPYLDPRVNVKYEFPLLFVGSRQLTWDIAGGIGYMTKMPIAAYLYPDKRYSDFEQLNYAHPNPDYRVMNVMTFVEDRTNYDLRAARNLKWEVRADMSLGGNRFSVTYFNEDMKDGFRNTSTVETYNYRRYDASGWDPVAVGRGPQIEELPYDDITKISTVSHKSNGSRTYKRGVEYTFSSVRIPLIRTRITISGAYFKTVQSNSQPLWYHPTVIVNGSELKYVGLYDDTDGMIYKSANTNVMFDTDIPSLGLNFSVSAQTMWFTSTQTIWRDGTPTHYVGIDGIVHPYTAESAADPYLHQLQRTFNSFDEVRVPVETAFNFKATKRFWKDRIFLALYVNRLLY